MKSLNRVVLRLISLVAPVLFFSLSALASLNVGTFNIRNFDKPGAFTNKNLLKETIYATGADLLAVQEIYNDSSFKSFVAKKLDNYDLTLSRCGGGGSQKLGFIYNTRVLELISVREDSRVTNAMDDYYCGSLRPALIGVFKVKRTGQTFAAISVHLKAGSGNRNFNRRATQYRLVGDIMTELEAGGQRNILAMGDFNTTGFIHRNQDFDNFQKLLSMVGANTSAEQLKCTSYWSGYDYRDRIEESSILDHVIYTDNFLGGSLERVKVGGHCQKAKCEDAYEDALGESYQSVSDHCPVTLTFR